MNSDRRIRRNTLVGFTSILGHRLVKFLGSVIFANVAGSAALGVYFVFMSLFRLLRRVSSFGIGQTIVKRVSEEHRESGSVVSAAIVLRIVPIGAIALGSLVLQNQIDNYVGLQNAWVYLIIALILSAIYSICRAIQMGEKRVDIASMFDFARDGVVVGIQIALILLGLGAFGLITGFALGLLITAIFGLFTIRHITVVRPEFDDIRSITPFAKSSYLDTLVGGEHLWLDVLLLGFFVTSNQIGIYGIAYSLAMFGLAFSTAIGRSIFPEISHFETAEAQEQKQRAIQRALPYAALFTFPLFIGAVVTGDLVLQYIYSFKTGGTALVILTLGIICFSIYQPIHQVLYGLDRPDLAFMVSFMTSGVNAIIAILLIPQFGITGAAVSTAISMATAMGAGVFLLRQSLEIPIGIPTLQWTSQAASAVLMGICIFGLQKVLPESLLTTVLLVTIGGGVYLITVGLFDHHLRAEIQRSLSSFG